MLRKIPQILMPACVMLFSATFVYGQRCDDEGVVRLGRRQARQSRHDVEAAPQMTCGPEGCPAGVACPPGMVCPDGTCQFATYGPCGPCGPGCGNSCCHEKLCHILHWLSPYHCGCTHPPDHGWAPPLKVPMNGYATGEPGSIGRVPVRYQRTFPASWTGESTGARSGFRYPMAYWPTDTTQLGYYYQQVPTWIPNPSMVPPVPHPAEYHTPDFRCRQCGHDGGFGQGCPNCPGFPIEGDVVSEGVIYDSMESSASPEGPVYESQPTNETPAAQPAHPYAPSPSVAPLAPTDAALEKSAAAPELVPVPAK